MSDSSRAAAEEAFRSEGLAPQTWANEPRFVYAEHQHPYHKVLICIDGSITFHTPRGEVVLAPGNRLDLAPGIPHSATVGDSGVTCMEGHKSE